MALTLVATPGAANANAVRQVPHNLGKRRLFAAVCAGCGSWRIGQPHLLRKHKYCSQACAGAHNSGSLAPSWRGGSSSVRQALKNTPEYIAWQDAVRARDGGRCRVCDTSGVRTTKNIEIHHIIPFGARPDLALDVNNGISLCRGHHTPTFGREHEFAAEFARLIGAPLLAAPAPNQQSNTPVGIVESDLRRLYLTEQESTRMIARRYGCTDRAVQKYLRRFYIPARSPREAAAVRLTRVA